MRLAHSARVEVITVLKGRRQRPDASTFAGKGKVEELTSLVHLHQASLVIFNHDLSPGAASQP